MSAPTPADNRGLNPAAASEEGNTMLRKELLDLLVENAKAYRKSGVLESLTRNRHMNQYEGEKVSGQTIDAILVDFINYVAAGQGVDLALYTKDLDEQ